MKIQRIFFHITFSASLLLASQAYSAEYKVYKLDQGLTLITSYFSHAPLASTYVNFTAGSMTETKDSDGLTHLFEHLFISTNEMIPSYEAFNQRLRELGAESNASIGEDTLDYYFYDYPSVYFDELTEIAAAVARGLTIDPETFKNEIPVVLDELDRKLTHPTFIPRITRMHLLFGEDLYHTTMPLGTNRKVIAEATVAQIQELRESLFAPQNTTIFVIGSIPHEKAHTTIKKYFGDWKNPPSWKPPTIPKLPKITKTERWNFSHPRNSTTSLRFDFPAFNSRTHTKETYIADLLIYLVKNRNSKFYKKYIESGHWLEGYYNMNTSYFHPESYLHITLKDNTVDETITEVLEEVKRWSEKGYFSEKDLESTKKQLIINFKVEGDNLEDFASWLTYFSMKVDPYYYQTYPKNLQNITLKELRQFIKDWMVHQPYFLTVNYNSKEAQKWNVDLNGDDYYSKYLKEKLEK